MSSPLFTDSSTFAKHFLDAQCLGNKNEGDRFMLYGATGKENQVER